MKQVFTLLLMTFGVMTYGQNQGATPTIVEDHTQTEPTEIFKVVEEMPAFPGCHDQGLEKKARMECSKEKLAEFISQNLKYPEGAKKAGVEGMAVVQFNVKKDGTLSNIRCVRDPGTGCGEAAMNVIEHMNANDIVWIPGTQRGKKVVVQYTLPIKFAL